MSVSSCDSLNVLVADSVAASLSQPAGVVLVDTTGVHAWIENYFGSVDAVMTQQIVKLTNVVTWEGALFNELRARRPLEMHDPTDVHQVIRRNGSGPFGRPLEGTPEDTFGRIRGHHSVTASNVAKYDGFHGLVIFDEHDPLYLDREAVSDYLDTALVWASSNHR